MVFLGYYSRHQRITVSTPEASQAKYVRQTEVCAGKKYVQVPGPEAGSAHAP